MQEDESGCLLWQGAKAHGYGVVTVEKRYWRAHIWIWTYHHGPVPPGLHVLHRCDQPACVNVEHLFLGTNSDNVKDKVAKGRQAQGEGHGCAKLTEEQVRAIRRRYFGGGVSQKQVALEFGIHQGTVADIVRRKTWKHIGSEP